MARADQASVVWPAYAVLGVLGLAASQYSLIGTGWLDTFSKAYEGDESALRVTGLFVVDLLAAFFDEAVSNPAATALFESLLGFASIVVFCFVIEASRRSVAVPQALVACLMLLSQLLGVGFVLPLFLAVLNRSAPRTLRRDEPLHQVHIMRSIYVTLCVLLALGLALVVIPATANEYPGGPLNGPVVIAALFLPALPTLAFVVDDTARGVFETKPAPAPRQAYSDRELSHYVIMGICGFSALVGLFVHFRAMSRVLYYDTFAEFGSDMVALAPAKFLMVDLVCVFLAAYVWLQVEALRPFNAHLASPDSKRDGARLLSWRDLLALLVFGPMCHFSMAFAGREYGLLNLDNLKSKRT